MPSLAAPTACRTKTTTGTATASVSGSYPSNSYVRLASCGRDQALKKNETGSEQSVVVVVYICKAVSCPPPMLFHVPLPSFYRYTIRPELGIRNPLLLDAVLSQA